MKKRIAVLLTALMIFSLSACGKEEPSQETGSETFPMTVTDYLGTEMNLKPHRKKSYPFRQAVQKFSTLWDWTIKWWESLIGAPTPKKPAGVEKVGDTYSVNVEKIIELDADVVFVSGAAAAESVEALNASGIRVYSIGAKT